jgi:small-conductance mechanosensitive channel
MSNRGKSETANGVKSRWIALAVGFFFCLFSPSGVAQDSPPETTPEETESEQANATLSSQSGRVMAVNRAVEANRLRLEQLNKDLKHSETVFARLEAQLTSRRAVISGLQAELSDTESPPTPERAIELEAEIARREEGYLRVRERGDLALETGQLVRKLIDNLRRGDDEGQFLIQEVRTGIVEAAEEPEPEIDRRSETPVPPAASPLYPGFPVGTPATPIQPPATTLRTETSEQIEALKEVQVAEAAERAGEKSMSRFVDLKELFDQRIVTEEALLETAQRAKEILLTQRTVRRAAIEALRSDPDSAQEIERLEGVFSELGAELEYFEETISQRTAVLDDLAVRHVTTNAEIERRMAELQDLRKATETAKSHAFWLQSPVHPRNLLAWIVTRGPRIIAVMFATAILLIAVRLSLRRFVRLLIRRKTKRGPSTNRADTLSLSFSGVASAVILIVGLALTLQEAGVDIRTVLGGAAVLGVAIGFGAQNLMRDYFTGFMILLEDQFGLGDLVTIGATTGRVEKVSMRTTTLRDLEGKVHFIPNGAVTQVTNWTYEWAQPVIDVTVALREKVDPALALLLRVAEELHADPEWKHTLLEGPVLMGVNGFTDSGVVLRLTLKTRADSRFLVLREMYRRVKNAFDEAGIEIGMPHRTVFTSTSAASNL